MDDNHLKVGTPTKRGHRRQASVGSAYQAEREGKLFEHFLLVGLPAPTTPVHSPYHSPMPSPSSSFDTVKPPDTLPKAASDIQVLYQYPASKPINPKDEQLPLTQVIRFCFPSGIPTKPIRLRESQSELNSILFGSMESVQKSANSFVFLLTNNTQLYYGVCVAHDEILERPPTMTRKAFDKEWNADVERPSVTTRVYCFVTKFPFFRAHFNVLYNIVARERLYAVEETAAAFGEMKNSTNDPNEILSMLQFYYEQNVPASGEAVTIKFPNSILSVEVSCPSHDEDKLIADWCMPLAYRALRLDTILLIVSAILTEKHVVIVCKNRGVLSSVVLSLIPILRPLVWQGPFIPILPSDLEEYLSAPVPFIVGVLKLPEDTSFLDALIVTVNEVTPETVTLPKGGLEPFFKSDKLKSAIEGAHQALNTWISDKFYDPIKTGAKQGEHVTHIIEQFSQHNQMFLKMFVPFISAESELTTELEQKMLETVPKKHKAFAKSFLTSQMFSVYYDEYSKELKEEQDRAIQMASQVEDKIKSLELKRSEVLQKIKYYNAELHEYEQEIGVLKDTQKSLQYQRDVLLKKKTRSTSNLSMMTLDALYKATLERKKP